MPDNSDIAQRIRLLAAEYVELVNHMQDGQYDDEETYSHLSKQRTLVHDELILLTGLTERKAMYAYCRELLRLSQST